MKFCPQCGKQLNGVIIEEKEIKECECGFIDYDNWVNVSTVVVAFNDKYEFLMVRMKRSNKGKLTFPGGYRNLHETLIEAAKREFFEETGYQINNLKLFNVYTKDDVRLIWIVFTACLSKGEFIENDETDEILFYSLDNPPRKDELRGELTTALLNDILTLNGGNKHA